MDKWMYHKLKSINKERMKKHIDLMANNEGKPKWWIRMDIIKNFLKRGCGYTDYFRGNYINLTEEEKDTFVTAKSFRKILKYLNHDRYEVLLHDKLIFNKYFEDYLKRDYISLKECSITEFEDFLKGKKNVFAKDPIGEGGHGVVKIPVDKITNVKTLYQDLKAAKKYLVEDEIIQSKALNEINPNVVNSFRVVTLYKDGRAHVIANALRVNQDATNIIGSTNDLYFSLNEKGKIDSNVIDDYGNIYQEHPLTKKAFKDVTIPDVKKAFEMCKEAARKIPEERYIGWDVAFSNKGPVLVEGNEYPGYGIIQFYKLKGKRTGHLKEIGEVLKDEMKNIKL